MFLFGALVPLTASGDYDVSGPRPVETPAPQVDTLPPSPDPTP